MDLLRVALVNLIFLIQNIVAWFCSENNERFILQCFNRAFDKVTHVSLEVQLGIRTFIGQMTRQSSCFVALEY